MLNLGTVYAWSFFQKPLCETYGWTNSQVVWTFSLAITFLGLSAAAGGLLLPKTGPRPLALAGAVLFGSGYFLAALALRLHSLPLLWLGYGVIGGIGLGLGYVTPVATISKWFPDRKGLATGTVVMGFGFGALLMSKLVAPFLLARTGGDLVSAFTAMGVIFLVLSLASAALVRNPPASWVPPQVAAEAAAESDAAPGSPGSCIASGSFLVMWLIFFCNITAGIALIGFQSPLFQDVCAKHDPALGKEVLAAYGGTMIAASSVFNGIGRFFWGALSDRLGRSRTFSLILGSQVAAFALLLRVTEPWLFATLVCYVLLCYGGGFGTMPSFVLDRFGARVMPAVYGAILTAWSAAGIAGPQLVALLKDKYAGSPGVASSYSFAAAIGLLGVGFVLSFFVTERRKESEKTR
ncbi:MFS transporter [Geomonas limicola]|uniref:MFS transporter n=1 Tax=Geomonas limicola TaxID=2740186 RepID=A0A6V8ND94_9BACT|nr:OFA family MFS transporter [Geomonas limicola]GFO69513.1 MFS transporter [Geomonas limicola]